MSENERGIPEEAMNFKTPELTTTTAEQAEAEKQNNDRAQIKNLIARYTTSPELSGRIAHTEGAGISEASFENALHTLLETEVGLSHANKLSLFRQALEYYANPTKVKKPLWHSTSSYSLRKSLEEGLSGGHGKFSGEAGTIYKNAETTQRGLSVSHPDHPAAETFQEIFARLSAKKSELSTYLKLDSEKITGKTLPDVFMQELFNALGTEGIREILARRKGVAPEEVNNQMIEEARQAFIEDFNKSEYIPNAAKIEQQVLPNISNENLKEDLAFEAKHPFPTMITLESAGKQEHLTSISRGEQATHIPFEDFYWDTFTAEDIREIRVPENQIVKVRGWLKDKGLGGIKVVPLEVFEVKRLIQDSI